MSFLRVSSIAVLLVAPAACASSGTLAAGREYYAGRADEAERNLEERLEKDADNRALLLDELGVIALDRRDLDVAYRRFLEASQIMGSFTETGAKEIGAIVGAEASKIWHGDAHEQAMNSYYLGIVSLLKGDDGNGLAGFKNAILVDSGQADEKYDCDFAPALFLEGVAYERVGDANMAQQDFTKAAELAPECVAVRPDTKGSLVVVVDVGRGPTKYATGPHGSRTRFHDHPESPAEIDVVVDGKKVGSTQLAGDVYFQATTRGGRTMDAILAGKAAYKSGAAAVGIGALAVAHDLPKREGNAALLGGAALLLSSLAVNAEADTRHWTTLPARVQLFRADVPPGRHDVEIVPSSGWRVSGPRVQTVTVESSKDLLVYQRVLP
jgi:tetratricopeptide (TPR) repeat protein